MLQLKQLLEQSKYQSQLLILLIEFILNYQQLLILHHLTNIFHQLLRKHILTQSCNHSNTHLLNLNQNRHIPLFRFSLNHHKVSNQLQGNYTLRQALNNHSYIVSHHFTHLKPHHHKPLHHLRFNFRRLHIHRLLKLNHLHMLYILL